MKNYDKKNIVNTYWSILILDACGDIYEEYEGRKGELTCAKDCAAWVLHNMKNDKELGAEYGTWDYRFVKHEEDDDTDWTTVYKVYKYRGRYKWKVDNNFWKYYR